MTLYLIQMRLRVFNLHQIRRHDLRCFQFSHYTESAPVDSAVSTRLEKLRLHYLDAINSFDCDSIKLTDLCSQKEFEPLDCLFERILAVRRAHIF